MTGDRRQLAFIFLRIVAAGLMLIHGAARIYLGIVDDFGEFLTLKEFPLGFYLAWAITIFEIVGSIILASGYYVSILALIFAVHLLAGILLVHLKDGWFVVGAGRNGVEYSVLLITVFLTIAIANFGKSGK
jgi:putative oxidoreductase